MDDLQKLSIDIELRRHGEVWYFLKITDKS